MKVIVVKDYNAMSELAAEIIASKIKEKPKAILGLATGSSPIGTYQKLIEKYQNKEISFQSISTYNLDEYCGIDQKHSQSYYHFMHENLFNHIDINKNNVHIPSGEGDMQKACNDYNNRLNNVVIDLQLLGIGSNGHIGFNEPGTLFNQETFVVRLTEKTREDNKRFFNSLDEVPTHAITMGIKNIMNSKAILMLISGLGKADTVVRLLKGEVNPDFPASILNNHPNVTILIDQDAYSKM